jgi:VanZ family protein
MNQSRRIGFASYVLPVILFSMLIYFVSSLSAPPAPTYPFEWGDKINHAGAYGIMMILALRATRWLMPRSPLAAQIAVALLYCMLYGGSDEIHQAFVPNRSSDIFDWIADTVGALLAIAFALPVLRTKVGRILFGSPGRGAIMESGGSA